MPRRGHHFDPYGARSCQVAKPCRRHAAFWSIRRALEAPGGRFGRFDSAHAQGWSTSGRSDSTILRTMVESDRPDVLHPQAWALSDRPNRPPGGSKAFQMLRKTIHLPHGFAIWQDRAPYGSQSCPRLGMGSSLRKWCCGVGQMQVLAPQGSETAIEGGYAARAALQGLRCTGYAAGAMLQKLCCTDYAARTLLQAPCCKGYHAGYADQHAPTAALTTQISMLQVLHWQHGSARSTCCHGHTNRHAPTAALATQISMPKVLHWPNRSACPKCCTGHTERHAPTAALATSISMLQLLHWQQGLACLT